MKKVVLQDGKWVEVEDGVIAPLAGVILNPFTGTPSVPVQTWLQIALSVGLGYGACSLLNRRKQRKANDEVAWLTSKPKAEQQKIQQRIAVEDFRKQAGLDDIKATSSF